jgi:hypothetical protein
LRTVCNWRDSADLLDSDLETRRNIEIESGELRCPRCLARDIVPSKPRGIIDDFMIFGLGLVPRHCRRCEKRFYVGKSRFGRAQGPAGDGEPTA